MQSRIKYLEFNDKSMKEMQDVIYQSLHYRLDPSIIINSKECMNCIDKLYIDFEGISIFDATDDTSDFLQTLLKKRKDSINSLKINASSLGLLKNMHIRVDEIDQEEKKIGKQFLGSIFILENTNIQQIFNHFTTISTRQLHKRHKGTTTQNYNLSE